MTARAQTIWKEKSTPPKKTRDLAGILGAPKSRTSESKSVKFHVFHFFKSRVFGVFSPEWLKKIQIKSKK